MHDDHAVRAVCLRLFIALLADYQGCITLQATVSKATEPVKGTSGANTASQLYTVSAQVTKTPRSNPDQSQRRSHSGKPNVVLHDVLQPDWQSYLQAVCRPTHSSLVGELCHSAAQLLSATTTVSVQSLPEDDLLLKRAGSGGQRRFQAGSLDNSTALDRMRFFDWCVSQCRVNIRSPSDGTSPAFVVRHTEARSRGRHTTDYDLARITGDKLRAIERMSYHQLFARPVDSAVPRARPAGSAPNTTALSQGAVCSYDEQSITAGIATDPMVAALPAAATALFTLTPEVLDALLAPQSILPACGTHSSNIDDSVRSKHTSVLAYLDSCFDRAYAALFLASYRQIADAGPDEEAHHPRARNGSTGLDHKHDEPAAIPPDASFATQSSTPMQLKIQRAMHAWMRSTWSDFGTFFAVQFVQRTSRFLRLFWLPCVQAAMQCGEITDHNVTRSNRLIQWWHRQELMLAEYAVILELLLTWVQQQKLRRDRRHTAGSIVPEFFWHELVLCAAACTWPVDSVEDATEPPSTSRSTSNAERPGDSHFASAWTLRRLDANTAASAERDGLKTLTVEHAGGEVAAEMVMLIICDIGDPQAVLLQVLVYVLTRS